MTDNLRAVATSAWFTAERRKRSQQHQRQTTMDKYPESQNVCALQECCGSRQSGKAVMKDIIHRLRRKADNLQTLVNMLPEQPTAEQDQQLWEIACAMER